MEKLITDISSLTFSSLGKVGLVYDLKMNSHKPNRSHPERPERLTSIITHLQEQNLFSKCSVISLCDTNSKDKISLIHSKLYQDYVDLNCKNINSDNFMDTYVTSTSNEAAQLAVDGVCKCVDKVLSGEWNSAFAVVRPPGHHANVSDAILSGFCIYNNVAIAAKYSQQINKGIKKVLIVDWDVHHGDSTQKFFYEDSTVLYLSMHRLDLFPGKSGELRNVGAKDGENYNVNLGWSIANYQDLPTVGDNEYVFAMERALLPMCREFEPDLVFISAGFDSAWGDPLGRISLTPYAYWYITRRLMTLAGGRVIVALEGGYNLKSIAVSAEYTLRGLLGEDVAWPDKELPKETGLERYMRECCRWHASSQMAVKIVIFHHGKKWNSMNGQEAVEYEKKGKKYDEKYREEYHDRLSFVKNQLLQKDGKVYCLQSVKEERWLKILLEMTEEMKKYCYRIVGEEDVEGKKCVVLDDPVYGLEKPSYWVVKFEIEGYKEDLEVRCIANTERLVVRNGQGTIVEIFDEKYDYGWNLKFNIDTRNAFSYVYKRLYYSGSMNKDRKKLGQSMIEFFKSLREFLKNEKGKLRESFRLAFIVDGVSGKTAVVFLNPEEYQESEDLEMLWAESEGISRLEKEIETIVNFVGH